MDNLILEAVIVAAALCLGAGNDRRSRQAPAG
jgi:hypothetical protein